MQWLLTPLKFLFLVIRALGTDTSLLQDTESSRGHRNSFSVAKGKRMRRAGGGNFPVFNTRQSESAFHLPSGWAACGAVACWVPFIAQCVMLTAGGCAHKDEWPPPHLARPALSEQLNSCGVLPAGITAQWPGCKKTAQRGLLPYCVLTPKVMSTPTLKILFFFFFCYRSLSFYERADARRKKPNKWCNEWGF